MIKKIIKSYLKYRKVKHKHESHVYVKYEKHVCSRRYGVN